MREHDGIVRGRSACTSGPANSATTCADQLRLDDAEQRNRCQPGQRSRRAPGLRLDRHERQGSSLAKDGNTWSGPLTGGIVKGTNQLNFVVDFEHTAGRSANLPTIPNPSRTATRARSTRMAMARAAPRRTVPALPMAGAPARSFSASGMRPPTLPRRWIRRFQSRRQRPRRHRQRRNHRQTWSGCSSPPHCPT